MTIRQSFPVILVTALTPICLSANRVQAGSFFGPSCYGSAYAYEYPNRAHNTFGCGQGYQCTARHPLFKHRWFRKNQGVPGNVAPVNGMPVNGMPVEVMQAPVTQAPVMQPPLSELPVAPASVAPLPAAPPRIAPLPAPLPAGPANPEPPAGSQTGKPPF